MATDDLIRQHEEAADREKQARAADLFDIRRIIGGLFLVYGLLLLVLGIGASQADIDRAAGTNVNLWTGIGMLVVGALFVAWALLRPVGRELVDEDRAQPGAVQR